MNAWLFQDYRQKQRLGDDCPWSVGWIDPVGKRKSKKVGSKSNAEKHRKKIEGELASGNYNAENRKQWAEFVTVFKSKITSGMTAANRVSTEEAMSHFTRLAKPVRMVGINAQMVDAYVADRRLERGQKKDSLVSPATVNKELRHMKAVLRVAKEWGYLQEVPRVRMLREAGKLPQYITQEHFTALYNACEHAKRPRSTGHSPADWWRALLVFAYFTGWRIGEIMALRRDDLDLDAGTAITLAQDNKGTCTARVELDPLVTDHLERIQGFGPLVFGWPHHRRTLDAVYHSLQRAAGIHLPCNEKHEHTDCCYVYGFHDLRRTFATMNAANMSLPELKARMRHKDQQTTMGYINVAEQLNRKATKLHVPDVLRVAMAN